MRVTHAGAVIVLLASLVAGGCGGSDQITGTPYEGPLLGTWAAVSIDGDTLPARLELTADGVSCMLTVSMLEFTFLGTGRYTGRDSARATCGGNPEVDLSRTFSGTFRVAGSTLLLREGSGAEQPSTFTISGDTLTITAEGDDGTSVTVLQRR